MNGYCKLLLTSLLCILTWRLSGQEPVRICGISPEDAAAISERLLENRAAMRPGQARFRSTRYVPIKFHLVARNDGSGRISEARVLDDLCALNADFAPVNIQFYIKDGFSYIDNTAVFSNHTQTINSIMALRRDPNAMNVWIVDNAAPSGSSGVGVTLGYYSPTRDWVVVNRNNLGANSKVLPHEIGHFFSLPHTHNGWDSRPWSLETFGNPAPATSPDGVPTERMDGSNCDRAGDFFCDTPPDYNGFGWPNCNYTGGARDPDSVLIRPDEANFMSYFLNCQRGDGRFSLEQQDAMSDDLSSVRRNYLRLPFTPPAISIDETPTLLAPANGADAPGGGNVLLQWTPSAGATAYLVEVDRIPTFVNPSRFIATSNSLNVTGLVVNSRYFWRVRPFNDYYACAGFTLFQSFTPVAGTSVNTIDVVDVWSISPNPVSRAAELFLSLETRESFEGDIMLYAANGQLVRPPLRQRFSPGENRVAIAIDNLPAGLYSLSLVSPKGTINQRVVVMAN